MEDLEQTKARRNGGKVYNETYSRERVEALKQLVYKFQQQGRPKYFSISIDGELIVPRTEDTETFDEYLDYMELHTETVEVRLYFGESRNSNRYIFHLRQQSLNGIGATVDMDSRVEQALEKHKLETRIMLLETELKRKRKKLRSFKELQAELDDKQIDIKELLTKGMELYGQFQASKVPGINGVQGLPPTEPVEIERELSEADKFYEQLKEQCSDKELLRAIRTWEILSKYPELRGEFNAIIQSKNQHNG